MCRHTQTSLHSHTGQVQVRAFRRKPTIADSLRPVVARTKLFRVGIRLPSLIPIMRMKESARFFWSWRTKSFRMRKSDWEGPDWNSKGVANPDLPKSRIEIPKP